MPRPTLTPADRAKSVSAAANALPMAVLAAVDAMAVYGPSDARTLAAWDTVEVYGATVHRQSRLLAGKSKGG